MTTNDAIHTFDLVISIFAILFGIAGLIWAYFELKNNKRL